VASAHEPTAKHFRDLKREIRKWRSVFEQLYKPLRSRFYAHRERDAPIENLLKETRIDQLEEMLAFLGSVYTALWEAFINGKELWLKPEPHSVHEMRQQTMRQKAGNTVQQRIVKEAMEMLRYAARVD
jgi:hypothetical protein